SRRGAAHVSGVSGTRVHPSPPSAHAAADVGNQTARPRRDAGALPLRNRLSADVCEFRGFTLRHSLAVAGAELLREFRDLVEVDGLVSVAENAPRPHDADFQSPALAKRPRDDAVWLVRDAELNRRRRHNRIEALL